MKLPRFLKALSASPDVVEALADRRINPYPILGGTNNPRINAAYQRGIDASYGWIYATQPAVRSVVDFVARNTAQLGLKLYERVGDNERLRDEGHPAARSLADPGMGVTRDSFIYRLVSDYLIWENAYVLKFRPSAGDQLTLVRLPPDGVTVTGGRFNVDSYVVWRYDGSYFVVPPSDMLHWYGYSPTDPLLGLSKLETLRQELAQDAAIQATLVELAKNGLKGGYIKRPLDAPMWDEEDATRFTEDWRASKLRRDGSDPVLEEGMEYVETGISPKDAELLSSRRFTKEEVAAVYGVPMDAFGVSEGTSPNTPESRRLVYADVLPPITNSLACQLDQDILRAEYSEESYYFEFDLNEKLRGDLENRFPALTASAGRPWQTVNEVRAKENLPPIPGPDGEALTIPLNVALAGEQGSPTAPQLPAPNVMPPQDANKPPQDGSYRASLKALVPSTLPRRHADMARQRRYVDEAVGLLQRFYDRQAQHLKSGGKSTADSARWNTELSKDIERFVSTVVEREGNLYVARLAGEEFDMRQVEHYVAAMAEGTAEGLNRVTAQDVEQLGAADAVARASGVRAQVAGASIGTRATVFARQEAAKQAPQTERRMKTWISDTERHADLDGVSVPLDADWGGIEPGSEPNCACSLSIS